MATAFFFFLQNRLIQTRQTGGQWYSNTSPLQYSLVLYQRRRRKLSLDHSLDGSTHPEYKLTCLFTFKSFLQQRKRSSLHLKCVLPSSVTFLSRANLSFRCVRLGARPFGQLAVSSNDKKAKGRDQLSWVMLMALRWLGWLVGQGLVKQSQLSLNQQWLGHVMLG